MPRGNPKAAEAFKATGKSSDGLRKAVLANADPYAEDLRAVIEALRDEGILSLREIAAGRGGLGIRTSRGGHWQVSKVRNLLRRLGRSNA